MPSSNRTIVGLKQCQGHGVFGGQVGSNRTIVGLKRRTSYERTFTAGRQQSHHCGIETEVTDQYVTGLAGAAIAPLWD